MELSVSNMRESVEQWGLCLIWQCPKCGELALTYPGIESYTCVECSGTAEGKVAMKKRLEVRNVSDA